MFGSKKRLKDRFFGLLFFLLCVAIAPKSYSVTFVVNSTNPQESISKSELANLFLKKKRYWPNGSLVRFIDRQKGQSEREFLLRNILGMSQRELDQYWVGKKLYAGDSAPLQADSDAMALRLVDQLEGGVSYVSNPALIKNFKVKPLRVTD